MIRQSVRGAGRDTAGATDTTMRIWKTVEAAGDEGLDKETVVVAVAPTVNAGYAKRRYINAYRHKRGGANGSAPPQAFDSIDVAQARRAVVLNTLRNMTRDKSLVQDEHGVYRTLRKPKYRYDERAIDMHGNGTRLHLNSVELERILRPAVERKRANPRAGMTKTEMDALEALLNLVREARSKGWPGVA